MQANTCHLLPTEGVIKVQGVDALKFLQGQLTCDVRQISPQKGGMGALCNYQGRVLAIFYSLQIEQDYYLILPRTIIESTLKELNKYAVFSKVKLEDVSATYAVLFYPAAHDAPACSSHLPGAASAYLALSADSKLQADNSAQAWLLWQIQHGIPAIHPSTQSLFLPHDLNLPELHAVSFDKGCYTGQEIIARMHYRGVKKHALYCAQLAHPHAILPGTPVQQGDTVAGHVVLACTDPTQTWLLLSLEQRLATQTLTVLDGQEHVLRVVSALLPPSPPGRGLG